MKEKIKFVIWLVIFIAFMIVAIVGYKKLLDSKNNNEYMQSEIVTDKNQKKTRLKEFEVYINENQKLNIKSLVGKPIIINIWTSWCMYCKIEMRYFNELYLKEKENINFMMINATADRDSIENANKFVNENNYDFEPYYDLDLEALNALKIYSYPTTIFVDKDGYIISTKIGTITKEELQNKIEKLKK